MGRPVAFQTACCAISEVLLHPQTILFMDSQTRLGLELFGAALVLGVLGDQLLRVVPWGLNAFVWIGCLVVASYGLAHRWRAGLAQAGRWFVLPLCVAALLFL